MFTISLARRFLLGTLRGGKTKPIRRSINPVGGRIEQLEDRSVPATLYVGNDTPADFLITNGPPGMLASGDTVTWNPNGTQDSLGPVSGLTFGTNAFSSIQSAVNAASSGDTIQVEGGIYPENVTVNQSVTLIGANNTSPIGGRSGPEAVVEPGLTSSYDTSSVFTVTASNVTIEGFTIQGSISGTPAGGQSAGFTLSSGTTVYAAAGVSNSSNVNTGGSAPSTTDISGLIVQNNIIQDFTQEGVYGDTSDGAVSTGNTIATNLITDIPSNGTGGYYGQGVVIYDDFYASVTGNTITKALYGVQTGNNYVSAGAFAPSISGNTVSAYVTGIYYNLQYDSASGFTISNNTITQADPTVAPVDNVGLQIQSIQGAVPSVIQGNNVSGFLYGVEFAGNNTTSTVTLQGGILSNNIYGIWATNNDYYYPANYDTTAALSGVTITNSTTAGIWLDSNSPNINSQTDTTDTVTLAVGGGTSVTGGGAGLLVTGSLSLVTGNTLNNTAFSGQTGNYITLSGGALFGQALDATAATFGGLTGTMATVAQNFAIEDKIQHAIDDPTVGLVRVTAGNLYVTPNSFVPPTTTTPSIQRAINIATSGDTINVEAGTYPEDVNVTKTQRIDLFGSVNVNSLQSAIATVVVDLTGSTLTTGDSLNTTYTGTLVGSGNLTKTGVGVFTLGGGAADGSPNTYSGVTTIQGGTLQLNKANGTNAITGNVMIGDAVGTDSLVLLDSNQIADTAVLTFTSGGSGNNAEFDLNGYNETVGGIQTTLVSSAAVIQNVESGNPAGPNSPSILTVNDSASFLYDGLIRDNNGGSGTVALVKEGAGTLTLLDGFSATGTSYSGSTTINGGILLVNGDDGAATGAVAVNSSGGLGGTGTIGGPVTVNTGGTITGGTLGGIGILTVASIAFNGGTYAADFSAGTSDSIVTAGTINLDAGTPGVFLIASQGGIAEAGTTFTLIKNTGPDPIMNPGLTNATDGGATTIAGRPAAFSYFGGTGNSFTIRLVDVTAVGPDAGQSPTVTVLNAQGTTQQVLTTVSPTITGGVRTAIGDFTGDGVQDIAVGSGPGTPSLVQVFDGATGQLLFSTSPFGVFTGGVFVSAGDISNNGMDDLVVSPDQGGGPRVLVYGGGNFQLLISFFGITDPNFRGGCRTAVGDINGDGFGDIVVAAGAGGAPRVAAWDGRTLFTTGPTKLFNDFYAFDPVLRDGAYVSVGDINGDGFGDLIVGPGAGGGPRTLIYSGADLMAGMGSDSQILASFYAGDSTNRDGVRVVAKVLDGTAKDGVVVGPLGGIGGTVTAYSGDALTTPGQPTPLWQTDVFPASTGAVFVG